MVKYFIEDICSLETNIQEISYEECKECDTDVLIGAEDVDFDTVE